MQSDFLHLAGGGNFSQLRREAQGGRHRFGLRGLRGQLIRVAEIVLLRRRGRIRELAGGWRRPRILEFDFDHLIADTRRYGTAG